MGRDGELSTPRTFTLIRVCLVVFAVLSVLVDVLTSSLTSPNEDLFIATASNRFSQLSRPELLHIWHTDCHRRCRYQITSHVEIACLYDPYRVIHRRRRSLGLPRTNNSTLSKYPSAVNLTSPVTGNEAHPTYHDVSPFIPKNAAVSFLRHRRATSALQLSKRTKRDVNIMEECCFTKACAWEEYGEYCQRHPRSASERDSVCTYS